MEKTKGQRLFATIRQAAEIAPTLAQELERQLASCSPEQRDALSAELRQLKHFEKEAELLLRFEGRFAGKLLPEHESALESVMPYVQSIIAKVAAETTRTGAN